MHRTQEHCNQKTQEYGADGELRSRNQFRKSITRVVVCNSAVAGCQCTRANWNWTSDEREISSPFIQRRGQPIVWIILQLGCDSVAVHRTVENRDTINCCCYNFSPANSFAVDVVFEA